MVVPEDNPTREDAASTTSHIQEAAGPQSGTESAPRRGHAPDHSPRHDALPEPGHSQPEPQPRQTDQGDADDYLDDDDGDGFGITADLVPLYSWGSGTAPSAPSVDSDITDEFDSAVGSIRSSTMSARSSIYHFREENGRTYHRYKEGKYHFPNDQVGSSKFPCILCTGFANTLLTHLTSRRSGRKSKIGWHALFLMTVGGKLYLAPIQHPQHVLDIGTGTGIWAIEFAMAFPGANILGTDLSPIQPNFVPVNCVFEIDDVEDEWIFSQRFDFIHARFMISCFPDHKKVIQSCFDGMAPGGWCEWQDLVYPFRHVGPIPDGCYLMKWSGLIGQAAERLGRPWANSNNYKRYFEEVGFINVVEHNFYWPAGTWAEGEYYKSLGVYFREDMRRGMDAISMKLLPVLGWSLDEIQVLVAKAKLDMENPYIHAYIPV